MDRGDLGQHFGGSAQYLDSLPNDPEWIPDTRNIGMTSFLPQSLASIFLYSQGVAGTTPAFIHKHQIRKTHPMVVKPAIGFLTLDSDAQLTKNAQTIVNSMTNNPSYPTPSPTLASVTTAINDFSVAIDNAADGGKTLTLIKNQKRAALGAVLRNLASYVHVTCQGDLATLTSSGFPIQKPSRTPVGVLPAPETPVLDFGARSGELVASTPPITNGYTYNWRVALATAPGHYVQRVQTTAASNVFDGLTPGQIYLVDLNVVGSAGPSDWSDTAQLMVV